MQLEFQKSNEIHPQVKELLALALVESQQRGMATFDEKDLLTAIVTHDRNWINSFLGRKGVNLEQVYRMPYTEDPSFQSKLLELSWKEAAALKSTWLNPSHCLLALLTFPLVIEHLQVKPHWRRSIMRMLGYF